MSHKNTPTNSIAKSPSDKSSVFLLLYTFTACGTKAAVVSVAAAKPRMSVTI